MAEKFCDSTVLDKALKFAIDAHKNTERRGKGYPYIVHPMEVVTIVADMTADQELLAAAALHDVVEDTPVSIEEIEKEFGERVAKIVGNESETPVTGKSESESWIERKEAAIKRLAAASFESKMVALGDKLSNMRAISKDYSALGEKVWDKFHVNDPKLHEWHYRGLAKSLEELKEYSPYREFVFLIDKVFKHD